MAGERMTWITRCAVATLIMLVTFTSGNFVRAAEEDGRKLSTYETTGKDAVIDGLQTIRVEGIGFVVGLKGTGSNPPPNNYRKMILEEMKKNDVEKPTEILESSETCVVLLRAYIPAGARKGDLIDVEVWVPPGDEASSLKGGYLLEARLTQMVVAQGEHTKGARPLTGDTVLKVDGPVLVMSDTSAREDVRAASLRKGKILGRGRVLIDRDFRLMLADGKRSQKLSRRVAQRINQRFRSSSDGVGSKGIAKPVDYQTILLTLPSEYKYNIERFLHVVRRIPMSEAPTFQDKLLSILEAELMNPQTAIEASLRLESLGVQATAALREGLLSDHEIVRFCSAQSLAYLKDNSGYKTLAELADRSNIYRSYALAALVARENPLGRSHLGMLLNSESSEARYGAFRALYLLDPTDPVTRSMELGPDHFSVHVVETTAPPMVHISQNFRREIVLFNPRQQVFTPMSIRAGENIHINASAESGEIHLASFRPGPKGTIEQRRTASANLGDVIAKAAELGATYPDIVDFLVQAAQNRNLEGRLEINALPRAMPLETLEAVANNAEARRWASFAPGTPSLFSTGADSMSADRINQELPDDSSTASSAERDPGDSGTASEAESGKPPIPWYRRLFGGSAN